MIRRKIGEAAGAERGGGLLHLAVHLDQQRLHRADDEGKGDEEQGDDDGGAGEGDVDPERAVVAVERQQGEAGDDRRQREGEVDDRVDRPPCRGTRRGPGSRR